MTDLDGSAAGGPNEPFVIVCGYADGMLPSSWYRAYKRVKQTIRRGSYDALVSLAPTNGLPETVDLLIVPAALAGLLAIGPRIGEVLAVDAGKIQAVFDLRIARLAVEGRLQRVPTPSRGVAVHHGFRAVGERASFGNTSG